jgi:hypothetical protein
MMAPSDSTMKAPGTAMRLDPGEDCLRIGSRRLIGRKRRQRERENRAHRARNPESGPSQHDFLTYGVLVLR